MKKPHLRDYIIANMLDGKAEGMITFEAKNLIYEIEDVVAFALMDALGLHDWAEGYYGERNDSTPNP